MDKEKIKNRIIIVFTIIYTVIINGIIDKLWVNREDSVEVAARCMYFIFFFCIGINIHARNGSKLKKIIVGIVKVFIILLSFVAFDMSDIDSKYVESILTNNSVYLVAVIIIKYGDKVYLPISSLIKRITNYYRAKKIDKKENDKIDYTENRVIENSLYELDPYEYEEEVAEYLRSIGYLKVDTTPRNGDYGADVIASSPNGTKICVQCKRYKEGNNVGVKAVQEIYSAKNYYNCDLAYIFTTSTYTQQAREFANKLGVVLLEYK